MKDNFRMSFHKAQAILLGLALGDALGWPTEFCKLSMIKSMYGDSVIQEPPNSANYAVRRGAN